MTRVTPRYGARSSDHPCGPQRRKMTTLALTPLRGHLVREDVHHGTHTSGVHS
jgi:hypothetical protein